MGSAECRVQSAEREEQVAGPGDFMVYEKIGGSAEVGVKVECFKPCNNFKINHLCEINAS
jgi:hypothetical protein